MSFISLILKYCINWQLSSLAYQRCGKSTSHTKSHIEYRYLKETTSRPVAGHYTLCCLRTLFEARAMEYCFATCNLLSRYFRACLSLSFNQQFHIVPQCEQYNQLQPFGGSMPPELKKMCLRIFSLKKLGDNI
ncbi:hypothetical protein H0G86_006127 [Trichoderma simmonsii]|uniref:Uncharacterized protein n=1 Tax=Trichoderma simmonsii TaxID=1491479 RepID=A0A8G0LFY6_9HYPO|nr:hypothetical protein H0G86_006127 [Trichoderma simmonsii]